MDSHERTEKCKEVYALLSEYLDLDLPPDICQEVEGHLSECLPCMDFAESLRETVDLCKSYRPGELPKPIERDVREQLLAAYQKMLTELKAGSGSR